jgi:glycogen operon protein
MVPPWKSVLVRPIWTTDEAPPLEPNTIRNQNTGIFTLSSANDEPGANTGICNLAITNSTGFPPSANAAEGRSGVVRFDLASILSRDSTGPVLPNPSVLWDIESDPALAGTKLIAEAWDAAGLYQMGSFVGDAWREWNARFRDDARDFFRGEPGSVGRLADRMLGSHEVYGHKNRGPEQSIHFVTCHDEFSLNDLVSYNHKHNEANREENRDGANDNKRWNCGVEGPSDDPMIERLRNRQVKNFLAVTMLSLGVPMIVMGDEVRRTQGGNNDAYCHHDESNWFD